MANIKSLPFQIAKALTRIILLSLNLITSMKRIKHSYYYHFELLLSSSTDVFLFEIEYLLKKILVNFLNTNTGR